MADLNPAIIFIAALAIFLFALFIVFYISKRSKKALASFVQSRGLIMLPDDAGSELESKLVEKLGVPSGGRYKDIVELPLSVGEAYFYTQLPQPQQASSSSSTSGNAHHFITVFMDLPASGRTFVAPRIPIGGEFGKKMVEFILKRVFDARDITILDIKEAFPDFAKIYNVFTEDEEGAKRIVLSSGVMSSLMTYPGKNPVNIAFSPSGFGIDIQPMMRKPEEMDRYTVWAENLARVLKDVDKF